MTAKQIKNEAARIEALPVDEKRAALEGFRAMIQDAGMSDFVRPGYYTSKLGTVHISDLGSCGVGVHFTSAADVRKANTLRARRDNIRRAIDR